MQGVLLMASFRVPLTRPGRLSRGVGEIDSLQFAPSATPEVPIYPSINVRGAATSIIYLTLCIIFNTLSLVIHT